MGDETRYLKGQYDGSGLQRSVQHMGDLLRAHEMEQEVKEVQQNLWEREEGRIAQIYGVSETDGDGLGRLLEAYAEEDKYNEYLVDGAVLTCDQATLEPFPLPDGGEIVLEPDSVIYPEIRRLGVLRVEENLMSVNGKIYATVGDTVKDVNVMPFRCNCRQKVNRDEEEKRIKGDPECGKYGVCRHLMQLNEKWDNMPRTTGYMKLRNALSYDTAGAADVLDSEMGVAGEEGITMTSVLFCKHGGLIRAVTSGQEEVIVREETDTDENERMKEAYDTMNNWLLEGYSVVSEEELIQAMEYLAENGKQNSISPLREIPQGTIDKTTDEGLIMLYKRINDCIKRQEKYDNMVLAWTNYWNMRMESEFGEGNYAPVRADVVKAMLVVESNMGGEGSSMITNGQRDIKQALDCRNPVIWAVVNEYGAGRTVTIVYAEEDVESIDIENTQTVTVSSEMKDGGYGNRLFFGNGEWGVIQELFSENYDTFYAGRVMPEMSMAVGVGWYCMKLNGCGRVNEGKSLNRSEERAVFDYNGEGDSQYIWKIDNILQNMGVDILERPYE